MTDKKDLESTKDTKESILDRVKTMSPFRSRNYKKRAQHETDLLDQLTKLGEAGEGLKKQQNRLKNMPEILEIDDRKLDAELINANADVLAAANRLADQKRKARISKTVDETTQKDADIDLEMGKQTLENLRNPPPPDEPKNDVVEQVKKKREEKQMLDEYLKEETDKINKLESDGALDSKAADLERKNLQDHIKQAKRRL